MDTAGVITIIGTLGVPGIAVSGYLTSQMKELARQVNDVRVTLARIEQKLDDHINDDRAHVSK